MSKATPGPWEYRPNRPNPIIAFKGGYIARIFHPHSSVPGMASLAPFVKEAEANARLIAAAPVLLEALQSILNALRPVLMQPEHFDTQGLRDQQLSAVYEIGRAAIALAEGKEAASAT